MVWDVVSEELPPQLWEELAVCEVLADCDVEVVLLPLFVEELELLFVVAMTFLLE